MITIHKWTLNRSRVTMCNIPEGARFRYIANQNNDICLWFEVDTGKVTEERTFEIYGTGTDMSASDLSQNELSYIGSVIMNEYVWHVYERA